MLSAVGTLVNDQPDFNAAAPRFHYTLAIDLAAGTFDQFPETNAPNVRLIRKVDSELPGPGPFSGRAVNTESAQSGCDCAMTIMTILTHPPASLLRSGNVLLLALITGVVVGTMMAAYMNMVTGQNQAIARSQAWNMAIPIAELAVSSEALTPALADSGGTNFTGEMAGRPTALASSGSTPNPGAISSEGVTWQSISA